MKTRFEAAMQRLPLIAILRGLPAAAAAEHARALEGAGFTLAEVPLNRPGALDAIMSMRQASAALCIGAGTVLNPEHVRQAKAAGAEYIVAPNLDADVMAAAHAAGLPALPGVLTPTEAFRAIALGAAALKIFPAEMAQPAGLSALRQVLPAATRLMAVGGVTPENLSLWRNAGAVGAGLGGALYKPEQSPAQTSANAGLFRAAWKKLSKQETA